MVRAAALWEIACSVVLAVLLAAAGTTVVGKSVGLARGQHARKDMGAILEGCRQYEALHGRWPVTFEQVREVLPQLDGRDPWGREYVLGVDSAHAWVRMSVPGGGFVRMYTGRMYGAAARLVYEKRNVYGQ